MGQDTHHDPVALAAETARLSAAAWLGRQFGTSAEQLLSPIDRDCGAYCSTRLTTFRQQNRRVFDSRWRSLKPYEYQLVPCEKTNGPTGVRQSGHQRDLLNF